MKKITLNALMAILLTAILLTAGLLVSCGDGAGGGLGIITDDETGWNGVKIDTSWYNDVIDDDPDADEFNISTPEQLAALARIVNNGEDNFEGKTITQTASIDLNGKEWKPIGTFDNPFMGSYDGSYMTISGLKITNPSAEDQGLFGVIGEFLNDANEDIIVKKITLLNVSITGYQNIGAVAGFNHGTLQYCSVTGSVKGLGNVGGVAGSNIGKVEYCSVTGSVTCSGAGGNIGGLVGDNSGDSKVVRCTFSGTVSGENANNVGGIVGWNNSSAEETVQGCIFSGQVTGADKVGGIAGFNDGDRYPISSRINYCSATGTITGKDKVGGIVGENKGADIRRCSAIGGSVEGNTRVGGVAGDNLYKMVLGNTVKGNIINCYATMNVEATAASNGIAGGVVGFLDDDCSVMCCYATGSVISGTTNGYTGGICGRGDGSITNSVALNESLTGSGSYTNRVAGSSLKLYNNWGLKEMLVNDNPAPPPVISNPENQNNGKDVTLAQAKTAVFWTTAGNWLLGGMTSTGDMDWPWDEFNSAWRITDGSFPTLKFMPEL